MKSYLSIDKQKELFKQECKTIDLKYEYKGYTGDERFAIVTEHTEKELMDRFPNIIGTYMPFVPLSIAQGKVIADANRLDDAYRKRVKRHQELISLDDEDFEWKHSKDLIKNHQDILDLLIKEETTSKLHQCLYKLSDIQRERIFKYFFYGMSYTEIANEEDVSRSSVSESIEGALKKLRKMLK